MWLWLINGAINGWVVVVAAREVWGLRAWGQLGGGSAPGAGWRPPLVAELLSQLDATSAPHARTAAINEATSEFESQLGVASVGTVGWRVCIASGVGAGCAAVMHDVRVAAGCVASGVVGALITWNLGRMADSQRRRLRERWNGLIRRLSGSFPQHETFGDRPSTM